MQTGLIYLHIGSAMFCLVIIFISWWYMFMLDRIVATQSIQFISIVAIFMYAISCMTMAYRLTKISSIQQPSGIYQWTIIYILGISWRIGQTLTYILFIKRLKYIFKSTKYKSSSMTYNILYILSIIFAAIEIIKNTLNYLWNKNTFNLKNDYEYFEYNIVYIDYILSLIIDSLLSIVLIYLFLSKLCRLNIDISMYEYEYNKKSIYDNNNNHSLNKRQLNLLQIISRITVLSITTVLSSQLLMIFFVLVFFKKDKVLNLSIFWIIFWSIDCIINSLCIFLSFDFAIKWYHLICYPFDSCSIKICKRYTKNSVNHLIRVNSKPELLLKE